jgi:uncharacterized protein YgbK (DUF1537 family)
MTAGTQPPKIAYYGDDFTGATDTLASAARAGLRTMLFLGVPSSEHRDRAGPLDCVGIAGAARSMNVAQIQAELEPVGEFFASLDAPVLHYKICSTFDSSPEIGSIGAAICILRKYVRNPLVAIVGGQPNLGRYCVFSNLFAVAGVGGVVCRIDRHPTMSRHPITPMREGDLRLHLAQQGLSSVRSIDYTEYDTPTEALEASIDLHLAQGAEAVLFDVARQKDLAAIGRCLWQRAERDPMLIVGASTVVQASAAHLKMSEQGNRVGEHGAPIRAASGPVFVLAGSLSPVTAQQIAATASYNKVHVDARRLAANDQTYQSAIATQAANMLRRGTNVLAVTTDDASAAVEADQNGRAVAVATGKFAAEVLAQVPVGRLGVAGGDTSSHAVSALGAWALSYVGQIAEGVALCRLHSDSRSLDGLEVMLKGGQMGPVEIFDHLAHGIPDTCTTAELKRNKSAVTAQFQP